MASENAAFSWEYADILPPEQVVARQQALRTHLTTSGSEPRQDHFGLSIIDGGVNAPGNCWLLCRVLGALGWDGRLK